MRFILGFLSALLGALAGWAGLAALVVTLAGPDRDGGIAMGAFFNIGPIGGVAGLIAGIWLFVRFGLVRSATPEPAAQDPESAPLLATRLSFPFAITVLLIAAVLGYWGWYEFIRSPYLSHGFMTLAIEFRLPPGMTLPDKEEDVQIEVEEATGYANAMLPANWRAHDGDRKAIISSASLMYKTRHRAISLTLPGRANPALADRPSLRPRSHARLFALAHRKRSSAAKDRDAFSTECRSLTIAQHAETFRDITSAGDKEMPPTCR